MANKLKHWGSGFVLVIFLTLSYASTLQGIINNVDLDECGGGYTYETAEASHSYTISIKVFDWDLNLVKNTTVDVEIIKYKTSRWDDEYCYRGGDVHKKLKLTTDANGEIHISETFSWYGFMDHFIIKASVADPAYTKDFESSGRINENRSDTNISFNLYTKQKASL